MLNKLLHADKKKPIIIALEILSIK